MGTIAISGSASGIGAATAAATAGCGARVIGSTSTTPRWWRTCPPTTAGPAHSRGDVAAPDGLAGLVAGAGIGPQESPPAGWWR